MTFRLEKGPLHDEAVVVRDLATDVARARSYADLNVQVNDYQGVFLRLAPAVDRVRAGVDGALDGLKAYLGGSADGLLKAHQLYVATDDERAAAMDATYAKAPPRPASTLPPTAPNTAPGPKSDDDRQEWETYQAKHKVDTGPGNPSSWQRPDDPPPVMRPAPPTSAPTPGPTSTSTPQPPVPQPTPPRPSAPPGPSPEPPR